MTFSGRRPTEGATTRLLLQLRAQCPACGKREGRRIAAWRVELYRKEDPDRFAETIQCRCGAQYEITVRAYTEATTGGKR